jgi:putative phosphoserine phosphatase/1-acylglycerol-3-phosphate O-acyltransferase
MQAGVPIVPIVIHNAGDVAPKGDFVFRPATVEVDVLAPVDTSNWRTENIEEHVARVRSMFLDALGQSEDKNFVPLSVARTVGPAKKKALKKKAPKKKPLQKTVLKKKALIKKAPKPAGQSKAPASAEPVKPALKKKALKKKALKKKVLKKPAAGSSR